MLANSHSNNLARFWVPPALAVLATAIGNQRRGKRAAFVPESATFEAEVSLDFSALARSPQLRRGACVIIPRKMKALVVTCSNQKPLIAKNGNHVCQEDARPTDRPNGLPVLLNVDRGRQ